MTDALSSIGIILTSFLLTLVLTSKIKDLLISRALLDYPNERSSHSMPVPRGGGSALMLIIIPALVITAYRQGFSLEKLSIIGGTVLLALISWRDDRTSVSPALRLGLHIIAACLGSMAFPSDLRLFSGLPFWLDRSILILGWAWFINLYNFMDGIDGITGVETITLATGGCIVMAAAGIMAPYADTLTSLLTGTALGFLAFNWHPAKIFMGDVGSVPLGFLTGFILLTLALHGAWVAAVTLPLYYLADSGLTLTKRALRFEKIWQPHRQHFYQQAALILKRHDKVVYRILAANVGLTGLAIYAVYEPWFAFPTAVVLVAILLGWMHKIRP